MISNNINKIETAAAQKQSASTTSIQKSASSEIKEPVQANSAQPESVATQESGQAVKQAELDSAVKQINEYVQDIKRDIEFSVDDDTGRTVIKVYDSKTEELIRQIPNEEVLELAKNLKRTNGLIFNAKA